jgi:hypothetical protein
MNLIVFHSYKIRFVRDGVFEIEFFHGAGSWKLKLTVDVLRSLEHDIHLELTHAEMNAAVRG